MTSLLPSLIAKCLRVRLAFAFLLLAAGALTDVSGQVNTNFTSTNIIRFSATNFIAAEDSIVALITVFREGPTTNNEIVTVEYVMIDGSAVSGIDYFNAPGVLTFFPGQDQQQFIVQLINDFNANGDVALTLRLQNPGASVLGGGAAPATFVTLGDPSIATLTITDDESVPTSGASGFVEIAPGNRFGAYAGTLEEWNVDAAPPAEANFTPYGPQGLLVTIIRRGGSRGRILVDWQTTTNIAPVYFPRVVTNIFGFPEESGGLAEEFVDFIPTNGTVVLNDYQMGTNILIRIPSTLQPEQWEGFGETNFPPSPKTFGIELTGTRAAPEEEGMGVDPVLGTAIRRPITLAKIDTGGHCFTRLHYTVSEGQRYARVRVRRALDSQGGIGAVNVHYVINPDFISLDGRGGDHMGNQFALEPGSDYSKPFIDYEPPGSPMWTDTVRNNGLTVPFQIQNEEEALIEWGDGEITDRYIMIPIIDDAEPEFNEDMNVILWKDEDDSRVHAFAGRCTIKIIDNDQPAGASENDFNPDNNRLTDPPYMATPGANNTVQAVATQPDGKVVLGGDFTAVNMVNRFGIARLNFDGSTDKSFNPGNGVSGFVRTVALQPDGKILIAGLFDAVNGVPNFNIARLNTNGSVDRTFHAGLGTDGAIRTMALQDDGRILIGGEFLTVGGTNRTYIARLNSDGKLDTSFDPGTGPSGPINSIAVTAGALDIDRSASGGPAEDRFLVDTGSSQGTVTVNYDFLAVPDQLRVYHAGTLLLDTGLISGAGTVTVAYGPPNSAATSTFVEVVMNEGSGLEGTIWYYDLQINPNVDPRPVIGGEFVDYNGTAINFIARLNLDGSLDTTFNPGTGADDVVYAVAKQGNKVIMAGDFKKVDLRDRSGVARLNEDGSLDLDFEPGSGFDNTVYSITVQPNGKPVLGGAFSIFNETRRVGLARLNLDGTLDTSFMDTAKNQFAGIPNPLSAENVQSLENFVRSMAPYRLTNLTTITNFVVDTNNVTNAVITTNITTTDHLFIGGRFERVGGGFGRNDIRVRMNIARLEGGATPGPGNIGFAQNTYSVDENAGRTFITLVRTNGSLAPISARFDSFDRPPGGPGIAVNGSDYLSTNYFPLWISSWDRDRQWSDAFMGPNNDTFSTNRQRGDLTIYPPFFQPPFWYRDYAEDNIFVTITDDNAIEGDEVLNLKLTTPDQGRLLLGGEPIPVGAALGKPQAELIIVDNDFNFGTLGFGQPEYFVDEDGVDAVINVTRVGGSSGAVSVDVFAQGGTATVADYFQFPTRRLTFANGQTNVQFTIRMRNDTVAELEETLQLFLTNPTGFPLNVPAEQRLDPARSQATLNIIDDDFAYGRLSFITSTFTANENAGEVTVTVARRGGNFGELFVNFATADGTAIAGTDYVSTNGVLHWVDTDTSTKSFTVKILDNPDVNAAKTFQVVLSGPNIGEALGAVPVSTVEIINDDAVGAFSFSQVAYDVDENGPFADITIIRQNGVAGTATVGFSVTNLTAIGTNSLITSTAVGIPDYVFPTNNTLTFGPSESSKSFRIHIIDDSIVEGEKKVSLAITNVSSGASFGTVSNAVLTIIDNELNRIPAGAIDTTFLAKGTDDYIYSLEIEPQGRILLGGDFRFVNDVVRNRLARLNPDGTLDLTFDPVTGPDKTVRTLDLEPDSRLLLGGIFDRVGGTNRAHLARLNKDSSVDTTFDPGAGTDNAIYTILRQPDGRVLMVGDFSTYRGLPRRGIARAQTNGLPDLSFAPGTGANGTVYTVALQTDGKILIGGDFTAYNEIPRGHIARLNRDGTLDTSFTVGVDDSVRTIVVQPDNKILIGGLFTTANGQPNYNRIARLLPNGQIDPDFDLGGVSAPGADGPVNVIALQIDGKILVGGDFERFNGRTRNRLTRLHTDGSTDPTINFGSGLNGSVSSIIVQPDRRILVAGGFSSYNGSAAQNLVRIHGGSLAGAGSIQFTSPFFEVGEADQNGLVTLRRTGGTTGEVRVDFRTVADTATPSDFTSVSTNIVFEEGETFRSILIPVFADTVVDADKFVNLVLSNPTGGATLGAQPNARLTIVNDDMEVEFTSAAYSVTENFVSGAASISLRRLGSTASAASVVFYTSPGTPNPATPAFDYISVSNTVQFAVGEVSRTFIVPIVNDVLVEGNENIRLSLANLVAAATNAQARLGAQSESMLTIVDDDKSAGRIRFAAAQFTGNEGSAQAGGEIIVTLERIEGSSGAISVRYATRPGIAPAAQTPADYVDVSGIVSFTDGETEKSFVIPVFHDTLVEGNENIAVTLSNPSSNTSIVGATEALAVIVDDDLAPGSLDTEFNPSANAPVRVVAIDSALDIYAGGEFTQISGTNRSRIARLNQDGSADSGFDPLTGPNNAVTDIEIEPGEESLLISGDFTAVRGILNRRVARISNSGDWLPTFNLPLGLDGEVIDIVRRPTGEVVIGGMFTQASAAGRGRIAQLNSDGTLDVDFDPGTGADSTVYAVALQPDGKVLIGGSFSSVNGSQRRGIARLNVNGSIDASFTTGFGFNGTVRDIMVLTNGSILVAGDFTAYNGVNRSRVALLASNGVIDNSFVAGSGPGDVGSTGPNGAVHTLALQSDGKILIGGDFTQIVTPTGDFPRNRVARLNADGSFDPSFTPGDGANDTVLSIAVQPQDGKIVVAGRFTTFDRVARRYIARLNNDEAFRPAPTEVTLTTTLDPAAAQRIQITFASQPGRTYTLEGSTNLIDWVPVQTVQSQGTTTVLPQSTADMPYRFFRIQQ